MQEFRIESDALKREAKFSRLTWGTVLLLLAVAVFVFVLRASGHVSDNSDLGSLFVLAITSAAVLTVILAPREGLHRAERQMTFVLQGDGIIRKRRGYPEVKIAFSEIKVVREEFRWLVITSVEPLRKLAIPRTVSGYQLIRSELAKYHPLSDPDPHRAVFSLKSAGLLMVSILSWASVLWLNDFRAVIPASAVALISLAFSSYRLWTLQRRRPKHIVFLVYLTVGWITAALLIYLHVVRPLI